MVMACSVMVIPRYIFLDMASLREKSLYWIEPAWQEVTQSPQSVQVRAGFRLRISSLFSASYLQCEVQRMQVSWHQKFFWYSYTEDQLWEEDDWEGQPGDLPPADRFRRIVHEPRHGTSVCSSDESTVKREYSAPESIGDYYEKLVVSLNEIVLPLRGGIKHNQAWNLYAYIR